MKVKLTIKQRELLRLDFADVWACDRNLAPNRKMDTYDDLELLYEELYSGFEVTVTQGLENEVDCHYDKALYGRFENRTAELLSYRNLMEKIKKAKEEK